MSVTAYSAQTTAPIIHQKEQKTLVVGSEQSFPPFATGMTDSTAGGFTVEFWKAVAAEAGLKYTFRVLPFSRVLQEFKEGRVDVLINLAISDERHQFADFSVPHVVVHGAIFVRKDKTAIQSEDDLSGQSIIVLNRDLAHDYAISKGWGKQLVLVETVAEGLQLLASGKNDAMMLSKLVGLQSLKALGLTNVKPLKTPAGFSQKFAFAVPEGQTTLLAKINEAMAITNTNGIYTTLYDKWFGIYNEKELTLRKLLIYLILPISLFLAVNGYFYYQRQVERKLAAAALRLSEQEVNLIMNTAPNMIWLKDVEGVYLNCNSMFERFFGAEKAEIIGKTDYDFVDVELADFFRQHDKAAIEANQASKNEEWLSFTDDGHRALFETTKVPFRDEEGNVVGILGVGHDITERKEAEEQIRHLAMTDPLTGLANRAQFDLRFQQSMKLANREEKSLALMMVDLDKFKPVNDTFGHQTGDVLLQAISSILIKSTRETDLVVRLGGDEFAILLVNPRDEESVCKNAQRIIDEIKKPITIMGNEIQVGASIGVALYPKDTDNQVGLLKNADLALYNAKESGRGIFSFYHSGMNL